MKNKIRCILIPNSHMTTERISGDLFIAIENYPKENNNKI